MLYCAEVSWGQLSEMQLAGRLAVSAAALFLLTLVYRYYKTRVSPRNTQEGTSGGSGANQDEETKQYPVDGRVDKEESHPGLRHRKVKVKRNELTSGGGSQALGKSGLESGPPGREMSKELRDHLGTNSQRDKQGLDLEEDEEGEEGRTGVTLLNAVKIPVGNSVTKLETNLDFQGPCSQSGDLCSYESDRDGPSRDLCLPPHDNQQTGRGAQLTTLERSNRHLLEGGDGLTRCPGWMAEVQLQRERIQSFEANAKVSLAISHSHPQSTAAYTFSSVAQVQVEENLIQERRSMEINDGQAKPLRGNIRGKVYDYYVQSMSQSIVDKKADTSQSYNLSTTDTCNKSEMQLYHKETSTSSISEYTGSGDDLLNASSASPDASEDDIKSMPAEDQRGMAIEGNPTQIPPEPGCYLSRKGSFHKIMENPELQVPMEGFGSPAPGSSKVNTSPLVHLLSTSISSPLRSMKTTQSDTKDEPVVELLAGAKFLHLPLSSDPLGNVLHLDLGNCYEILHVAKKQKLKDLQEAAYKVMSDNYLQVLRTNAIYGRLNAMERDLILQQRMRGKKYLVVADVSSQESGGSTSRLCYYDDQKDIWHPLTHLPIEAVSRGCTICSMFNYLFVVAGCERCGRHQRPSNRVFCFNPLTNIWREIHSLNQARPHCKLVALDGCLYAIGGECLYTVERYNPHTDRWSFAAPLPNDTFAVAHTATVCNGEIYVTGGTLHYMLLRYAPQLDVWKVSLTGGSKDRTTEMVAVNGFLYRFDLNRNMGIGVYRCGSRTKLWYECATHPMPFPSCFQCAVVENLVYCVSRQFNIRFLADPISPRFGTKELQNFPSPRGILLPVTLVLPAGDTVQTRV